MRSLTMPATQCDAKVIDELKTRLIRGVSCEVDLEEVSSIMPEDKDADTPFAVAQDYAVRTRPTSSSPEPYPGVMMVCSS